MPIKMEPKLTPRNASQLAGPALGRMRLLGISNNIYLTHDGQEERISPDNKDLRNKEYHDLNGISRHRSKFEVACDLL
jgi:hypothetical protein